MIYIRSAKQLYAEQRHNGSSFVFQYCSKEIEETESRRTDIARQRDIFDS